MSVGGRPERSHSPSSKEQHTFAFLGSIATFFHSEMIIISELDAIPRLLLAALCGFIIGVEREHAHKPAGLRTNTMVCVGSCLFTLISIYVWHYVDPTADPSRIASQIVAGVGFLGAAAVLKNEMHVSGITTAATIWATAAVGMTCGFGLPLLGLLVSISTALFLFLAGVVEHRYSKPNDPPK